RLHLIQDQGEERPEEHAPEAHRLALRVAEGEAAEDRLAVAALDAQVGLDALEPVEDAVEEALHGAPGTTGTGPRPSSPALGSRCSSPAGRPASTTTRTSSSWETSTAGRTSPSWYMP